jgi:molybdopterin molybdotransferase
MIDYQTAREIVLEQTRSFGHETVPLSDAMGRVLAGPVAADRDYPPFNRSTMDGYALRLEDLGNGSGDFSVIGTVYAGNSAKRELARGETYRIMTGAPVPKSAGLVIRREDVEENADWIRIKEIPDKGSGHRSWKPFLNIAIQGEDLRAGQMVLGRGTVCTPSTVGLLATLGQQQVTVEKFPKVAIITTGDEVVELGSVVGASQIRNSNRWLLQSLFKGRGGDVALADHARDDPGQLGEMVERVKEFDLVALTGGVSAGDADHTPAVLESAGIKKLFHKMAIRPGKPTWCGVMPGGGMVFGLPGNPFSCLVNFILLIRPWIESCQGQVISAPIGLPLGFAKKKLTPLDEFFPVVLRGTPGTLQQVPLNGSGDIRLASGAGYLALHAAGNGDLPVDSQVLCYPMD